MRFSDEPDGAAGIRLRRALHRSDGADLLSGNGCNTILFVFRSGSERRRTRQRVYTSYRNSAIMPPDDSGVRPIR